MILLHEIQNGHYEYLLKLEQLSTLTSHSIQNKIISNIGDEVIVILYNQVIRKIKEELI